jgi:hypothetical protein
VADLPRYLPGNTPGLLDGYVGPVDAFHETISRAMPATWASSIYHDGRALSLGGDMEAWPRDAIRLDLHRPEARFRVACWLAAGERCPRSAHGGDSSHCEDCDDTGYLRPPAPLWWAMPMSEGGEVERADWSAAILVRSVTRGLAGLSPVLGLRGPREVNHVDVDGVEHTMRPRLAGANPTKARDLGMSDEEWLASGYALVDGDTLRLPPAPGEEKA